MILRITGALLILIGSGGIGFSIGSEIRQEIKYLSSLRASMEFMARDLRFRLVPLPELCKSAANETGGELHTLLLRLSDCLSQQYEPDAASCMRNALDNNQSLPSSVQNILLQLGRSLGRFDLQGQLEGLDALCNECTAQIEKLEHGREERVRGYRTLWLCSGAALVILLI